jgi:hypothetical protein
VQSGSWSSFGFGFTHRYAKELLLDFGFLGGCIGMNGRGLLADG